MCVSLRGVLQTDMPYLLTLLLSKLGLLVLGAVLIYLVRYRC